MRDFRGKKRIMKFLNAPVDEYFDLDFRTGNTLYFLNIGTVGQLCETSEAELLAVKNFGKKSLNILKAQLWQYSLYGHTLFFGLFFGDLLTQDIPEFAATPSQKLRRARRKMGFQNCLEL